MSETNFSIDEVVQGFIEAGLNEVRNEDGKLLTGYYPWDIVETAMEEIVRQVEEFCEGMDSLTMDTGRNFWYARNDLFITDFSHDDYERAVGFGQCYLVPDSIGRLWFE